MSDDIGPELDEYLKGEIIEPSCLRKPNKRRYRDVQKKPVSYRRRIYDIFHDNPGRIFTPSELYDLFKIKHNTIRKSLSDLRDAGLIQYERLNGRILRSYYVLTDPNQDILDDMNMPIPEFHGIKLEIYRPSKFITTITGEVEKVQILPENISERLTLLIGLKSEEKSKRHMDVFHTSFQNRDITIQVQKGKSHLVEIFMKATDEPISIEIILGYDEWLNLLFGEIWESSDIQWSMVGINRDVQNSQLVEPLQRGKYQEFRDFFLQVYNKGKDKARFEGHLYRKTRKLNHKAIMSGMTRSGKDVFNFTQMAENEDLKFEVESLKKRIEEITGSVNRQNDSLIDLTKVLQTAINPDHPTKVNTPIDPSSFNYG